MHQIDMTTGRAAIAYTNQKPWHGLGAEMPRGASLLEWEAAAGLGWKALEAPVLFRSANDTSATFAMPDRKVIYRSDTNAALGVVGSRYNTVQPEQIIQFYEDLCSKHGYAMETMGAIRGGRVVWALAKTGVGASLAGDQLNCYLLLSTSYDGTSATNARFTSVRVVCNNTLTLAMNERAEKSVSISHSSTFDADAVKVRLGVGEAFERHVAEVRRMANTEVAPQDQIKFLLKVYHDLKGTEPEAHSRRVERNIERLAGILTYAPGADMASAQNTVWGLLNAVTYDVDHSTRARSDDGRLSSAWFGAGAALKERAYTEALALTA